MTIKFIGNKQKLMELITNKILAETKLTQGVFVDLFTGTASVAKAFKDIGFNVIANDKLKSSVEFAKANLLLQEEPSFEGIKDLIGINSNSICLDTYGLVLDYLNSLPGVEGLFYKEYSPSGESEEKNNFRMYFTKDNAKKIDAIRSEISYWKENNLITDLEYSLLICSLMLGVNKVANVSGTYGAYLKKWYDRALTPLNLNKYQFSCNSSSNFVYNYDANELIKKLTKADIIYLDPPYTKRQYHSYYHILETIAIGDMPKVWGKTGLRPKDNKDASQYCYKRYAANALSDLVKKAKCDHLFLSYSTDGHITHEEIINILSTRGQVKYWDVDYKRFKSKNIESVKNNELKEVLYYVRIDK